MSREKFGKPILLYGVVQILSLQVTQFVSLRDSTLKKVRDEIGIDLHNYMKNKIKLRFQWRFERYGTGIAEYITKPNTRMES
jgi:hypothetical protein